MIRKQPTWYLAFIALVIVGLDQLTKSIIVHNLARRETWNPISWLDSIVNITHTRNSGAAFGIFPAGGVVFTAIGIIIVFAIIYYFHRLSDGKWAIRTALGLQLGGAIGNLTDRVRQGYVVDFVNFKFFPVFNVADSVIVIGVAILMIVMFLDDRREAREAANEIAAHPPSVESDAISG